MNRREMLMAGAATLLAGRARGRDFPGLTVRRQEPRNLEFPFAALNSFITPAEQFYVRSHFAAPALDPATYKLTVEGHVGNRLELTLDDLRKLAATSMPLTMECAGNGRVFLAPATSGLQWGWGAVGTAEWAGVPLVAVLDKAGVKPGATDVVLVGADKGAVTAEPATPGVIAFDRGIPLSKALKPEVLLALKMNGDDLPLHHGAPVRAVVGGWFGMASVKWLSRIVVTDRPYAGYWQTLDYSTWERRDGLPTLVPITRNLPKAAISRPALGEVVPAGKPTRVHGAAWAGETRVAKVEVSTDDGKTWNAATLTGDEKPFCWRLWEWSWTPASRGPARLLARATTADGQTQPTMRDPDRRTYLINHLIPVEVLVR